MREPTEEAIDGAMFLRHCSREEALEWLTREISDHEVEKYKRENPYGGMIEYLGCDPEQARQIVQSARFWEATNARTMDALRRCRMITAADLAVTINARDNRY